MKVYIDQLPANTKCCANCENWDQIGCVIGYCKDKKIEILMQVKIY